MRPLSTSKAEENKNLSFDERTKQRLRQSTFMPKVKSPAQADAERREENRINATHAADVREAKLKIVTDPKQKNPLVFKDSNDRAAASLAKVQRIMQSEKYKALPETGQKRLRELYYDKYIAPGYTQAGFEAPNKDVWVSQVTKSGWKPADYYQGINTRQGINMLSGTEKAAAEIMKGMNVAGAWVDKQTIRGFLGLSSFFGHPKPEAEAELPKYYEKAKDNIIGRVSQDTIDSATFWQQTHPSKRWQEKLDSVVGEQLIQLPLYEAIAGARIATGAKVLGGTGRVANLSKALNTSKIGAFAAKRLGDASDAFLGATLQDQSTEEKVGAMAGFMAFGALGDGVSLAGTKLIKKMSANTISMGGTEFQRTLTDEAIHELDNGILGHDRDGNAIQAIPKGWSREEVTGKPRWENRGGKLKVGADELEWSEDNKNLVFKAAVEEHLKEDPIKAKLMQSEKVILNSLAKKAYGKEWIRLPFSQRKQIQLAREHLSNQALNEIALHVPDLALANAQTQFAEDIKAYPVVGARASEIEKLFGVKPVEAVHEAEVAEVGKETGVVNSQNTIKKASEPLEPKELSSEQVKLNQETARAFQESKAKYQETLQQKFGASSKSKPETGILSSLQSLEKEDEGAFVPIEQLRAKHKELSKEAFDEKVLELSREGKLTVTRYDGPKNIPEEEKAGYVQDKEGNLYIAAASRETPKTEPKATANTAAENKDLAEWLEGLDTRQFIEELNDETGNSVKFENPEHALLWAHQFRDQLPKPIAKRITEELTQIDPSKSHSYWDERAKYLNAHLEELAYTGHLPIEGNVYKSTRIESLLDKTQWQLQLQEEVERQELANLKASLKQYPNQYLMAENIVKKLQGFRRKTKNIDTYSKYTSKIRETIGD